MKCNCMNVEAVTFAMLQHTIAVHMDNLIQRKFGLVKKLSRNQKLINDMLFDCAKQLKLAIKESLNQDQEGKDDSKDKIDNTMSSPVQLMSKSKLFEERSTERRNRSREFLQQASDYQMSRKLNMVSHITDERDKSLLQNLIYEQQETTPSLFREDNTQASVPPTSSSLSQLIEFQK